jgi:hypothetical protein
MAKKHNVSLYRSLHQLRKGKLHEVLGVDPGDTIPKEKIEAGRHSENEHIRKMSEFAHTMSKWKH